MQQYGNRRHFLQQATVGSALYSVGGLGNLLPFSPASASETKVTPDLVQLRPEIRPIVDRIDETPREKSVELLIELLQAGIPYRQLMAAAFLVPIRHGGSHSVYLMHSAHQMSLDVGVEERLLPLFWAVDVIKEHLGRWDSEKEPIAGPLPSAAQAPQVFEKAMEKWDREQAVSALIALARSEGSQVAAQRLWYYVARDWSFIGHLPISVVNCFRTLQTIGWQHAEPVLRYVVRDLHRRSSKKKLDGQPSEYNLDRVQTGFTKLKPDWASPESETKATLELLDLIRNGDWKQASSWAFAKLTERTLHAGTIWDAVHLSSAELMVRFQLGGTRISHRALHSNTSANALHYAFRTCRDSKTRFFILLQAVAWMAEFTRVEKARGMLRDRTLTNLERVNLADNPQVVVEEIFSLLPPRKFREEIEDRTEQDRATQLAFAYGKNFTDYRPFLQTARKLVCLKTTLNAHDVKYPMAVFEDLNWVSQQWRPHLLASSVNFLHGFRMEANPAVLRASEMLS